MSRRPILWGVIAGLLLVALLAPWTGGALGRLAAARGERDRLEALLARPVAQGPLLDPASSFGSAQAVQQRIERLARAGGVLVEEVQAVPEPAPLIGVRLRLSGPEKAVVALADGLTRERPLLRFRTWRLVPAEGGGVRLSGELVGVAR